MTEYEAAALAVRQAGLAVAYWQTGLSALTLVVSSGLVLYGFRLMRLGTEQRREEARRQHEETMTALQQQGAALQQQGAALQQQGAALRETMTALTTLIKRTAR